MIRTNIYHPFPHLISWKECAIKVLSRMRSIFLYHIMFEKKSNDEHAINSGTYLRTYDTLLFIQKRYNPESVSHRFPL